jgi:hypothetical protein
MHRVPFHCCTARKLFVPTGTLSILQQEDKVTKSEQEGRGDPGREEVPIQTRITTERLPCCTAIKVLFVSTYGPSISGSATNTRQKENNERVVKFLDGLPSRKCREEINARNEEHIKRKPSSSSP